MRDITISFLGTTSGGGPTDTRNCSSLVLDGLGNSSLWMFDCAEGTVRQFATQPHRYADGRHLKMSRVTKIFITHMHADHTMGIITLLRNVLGIHKPSTEPDEKTPEPILPKVEIYGPRGMRQFVRSIFTLTHTRSADKYTVHELLLSGESASASAVSVENDPLHESELPGKDFPCDANGFWRNITSELCTGYGSGRYTLLVDAGPILHRDPCIGYIVREVILSPNSHYAPLGATPEGRNIVILGDTHDPSGLIPLINSPPTVVNEADTKDGHYLPRVSLLIHEATDAYIPPHIDPMSKTGRKRTTESVLEKALEKGHSTPGMAGNFARQIGAERLVLNHIGARFPAPIPGRAQSNFERFRVACIQEIERQAEETWGHGKVTAAWDYYSISVPPYSPVGVPDVATARGEVMTWERRGEGSSYQREGRNDSWVPGPAYREKAGAEGMNVQAYDRAREWKETQRTQQGPGAARYSRQEYHTEAIRIESSQGNQEHKRASSSNVNHGKNRHRNRGGGSSRNGQQSEYSDKRPRNV